MTQKLQTLDQEGQYSDPGWAVVLWPQAGFSRLLEPEANKSSP